MRDLTFSKESEIKGYTSGYPLPSNPSYFFSNPCPDERAARQLPVLGASQQLQLLL